MQPLQTAVEFDSLPVYERAGTVRYADHVEFQPPLCHQRLPLSGNLFKQAASDRAHSAEENVELLILGEEETVVNDVEGLAQASGLDYEGYVRFRRTLGAGDDADAAAAERAVERTRNAGSALHVLTHDRYRRQILLHAHTEHRAGGYLLGEFRIEHLAGQFGILFAHAYGGTVLGRGLGDEEDAYAVVGQCREYAFVDTDDADHRKSGHRDHCDVAYGRYALYRASVRTVVVDDDGAARLRTEGVAYVYGYIVDAGRVYGRRIYDLRAEVAELNGLVVGKGVDDIGIGYDLRVGCHKAVHVRPYLQRLRTERGRYETGGVIGAAPTQIGNLAAAAVTGYEAGYQGYALRRGELLAYQLIGKLAVQDVATLAAVGLDEVAAVVEPGTFDEYGADVGRQPFTIADYGIQRFFGKVPYQAHSGKNALQLGKQGSDAGLEGRSRLSGRDDFAYGGKVTRTH